MKKNILWMLAAILTISGMTTLTACSDSTVDNPVTPSQDKSIVILYENDVHCSITGYTRIAGWRDAINRADTAYALPYFNSLVKIRATGEKIVSTLQRCCINTPEPDGDFPQCSGLRFTLHTGSHTVDHVQILQPDGTYADIDPAGTYTIALTDYCHHGGGFHDQLIDCSIIPTQSTTSVDATALNEYIGQTLGGTIPQRYSTPQGRITIVND